MPERVTPVAVRPQPVQPDRRDSSAYRPSRAGLAPGRTRPVACLAAVMLLLAACDQPATGPVTYGDPQPAAVPSPTSTPTPTPTATPAPPPDVAPPPEASVLLGRANAAMGALTVLRITGDTKVRAAEDSESPLAELRFDLAGNPVGISRTVATIVAAGVTRSFTRMEFPESSYVKDSATGVWEDEPHSPPDEPYALVMGGQLHLDDPSASVDLLVGTPVYRVSGSLPESAATTGRPSPGRVTFWLGIEDSFILRMEVEGTVPAGEYEGLVPDALETVFVTSVYEFGDFNDLERVAEP